MPNTLNRGYPYPDSAGHTRLWEHLQALADSVDADMNDTRANRMRVTSSMSNKQVHLQEYASQATNSIGLTTVTHTAGFTPRAMICMPTAATGFFGVYWGTALGTLTSTTAGIRWQSGSTGGALVSTQTGPFVAIYFE